MKDKHLRMKRAARAVLIGLLLGVAGLMKSHAYDFSAVCSTGQTLYYNITDANNHYVELTCPGTQDDYACWSGYTKPTGNIVLPETVQNNGLNYTVTSISHYAFYNCGSLTGCLTIPISVTWIGWYAFYGCRGFTGSLTIPNSVTEIYPYAFYGCSGFANNLIIPNSVIEIPDYAFYGCSGFVGNLTIPNSVTLIGSGAFLDCSGFTGSLILGNSVTEIHDYAFYNCKNFSTIICPVETPPSLYGDGVFNNTSISVYVPSSSVETYSSLRWGNFRNFYGFCGGTVTVSADPQEGGMIFGDGSFHADEICTVTAIAKEGYYFAHWFCNGRIVSVNAEYSFYVVEDVDMVAHFVPVGTIIFSDDNVKSICVSHWDTDGDGELSYAEAALVANMSDYFKDNQQITSFNELQYFIGLSSTDQAFRNCSGLTSIVLPNHLTTIGVYAFYACNSLSSVVLPNSVTKIGTRAFAESGLTNINIPNSVTEIGGWAFQNCNSLMEIQYNAVNCADAEYRQLPFSGCGGTLIIGDNVERIPAYMFYNCSGFTGSLTIPISVISIGRAAFSGCSGFTGSLHIPNSVTEIGWEIFERCSGFNGSLSISNSLTTLSISAFEGCGGFTGNLTIPNSVTTIGSSAFYGCSGFTGNLTIPNSVTTIDSWAFKGCSGLTSVTMQGITPPPLGYYGDVFDNTNFPIYVPYESLNAYKTAAYWSDYESRIFPWLQKSITAHGETNGWNFIASPLPASTTPTNIDSMIAETETNFDFYRFNQSAELEWENWKSHTNNDDHYHFNLVNGQGYLYANAEDVNLIFKGTFNEDETKNVELVYDANAGFAGWNLVGNPFPVSAYANKSYYTMNEDGSAIEPVAVSMETAISACTGVMVKATEAGQSVTFSKTASSGQSNQGALQIAVAQTNVRGNAIQDKAIVSFNAVDQLEKFIFNEDNAQLYIPQSGKDYAIAYSEKQGELPLNFKATKDGTYAFAVAIDNAEMEYLHLMDNLTGADVDLLQTPEYTFTSKTTDYASRFRLVFSICEETDDDDDECFAFFSGSDWIIRNESETTLQVIDVNGRILSSENVNGSVCKTINAAPGVYMLRLINGENVRTQKIVVR